MNRIFLAGVSALLLAGCSGAGSTGSTLGNLIAFNSPTAPAPVDMTTRNVASKVDCPLVDVLEGGSHVQIGSGAGLRHQFALGETSRECVIQGDQIVIRVGVSGRVLAGPAGGAGSFSVPVRVGVRREDDQKILIQKTYTATASIPAGSANGTFTLVSDPLTVPFTREEANQDYMVVVGLGGGGRR